MYRPIIVSLALISMMHTARTSELPTDSQYSLYQYVIDALAIPYQGNRVPLTTVYRHLINYFRDHSFDAVLIPNAHDSEPRITIKDGTILHITDACKTPIYISRMPRSCDELALLRAAAWLPPYAPIEIYTLNTPEEQALQSLTSTVSTDGHTVQYQYATPDFTAPTTVDLIRGVQMLRTRDSRTAQLACVHCKAGIGRSSTLVAAYLLYLYTIAVITDVQGTSITPKEFNPLLLIEKIVAYLQSKRPIVYLNTIQKNGLMLFYQELRAAGSFEDLYARYSDEINARDAELNRL